MTKDDEKAEVFNVFIASAPLNSKTSCSQSTQPPKPEDWDGEQNETPIILEESVTELLHHTDMSLWGQMGSSQES